MSDLDKLVVDDNVPSEFEAAAENSFAMDAVSAGEAITDASFSRTREQIDAVEDPDFDAWLNEGADDDEQLSVFLDIPKQMVGGFRDAADSIRNLTFDVAQEGAELLYVDLLGVATDEEVAQSIGRQKKVTDILPKVKKSDRISGQLTRGVSQFLAPFGALGKVNAFKKAGKGGDIVRGAVTDFVAFDEHEQRLSNMINEWSESGDGTLKQAAGFVTDYLKAEEDDGFFEGRMKNVFEGGAMAKLSDAVVSGVKYVKEVSAYNTTIKELKNQSVERTRQMFNDATSVSESVKSIKDTISSGQYRPNKEVVSIDMQKKLAEKSGVTLEELEKGDVFEKLRGMGVQDDLNKVTLLEEAQFGKAIDSVQTYKTRMEAGDATAARDFWANEGGAFIKTAGDAKDAFQDVSRALGLRGQSVAVVRGNEILKRIKNSTSETQESLFKAFADLADPDQVDVLVRNLAKPTKFQIFNKMVNEFYINSILSSPKTLMADTMGTAIWTSQLVLERPMAAGIGKLRQAWMGAKTSADRVYLDESLIHVNAYMGAIADGFRYVAKAGAKDGSFSIKNAAKGAAEGFNDMRIDSQTRFDTPRSDRAFRSSSYGVKPEERKMYHTAFDWFGNVVNSPTSFMQVKDDVTKALMYRAETRALAHRRAKFEGLTGDAYSLRVKELLDVPMEAVDGAADGVKVSDVMDAFSKGDDAPAVAFGIDSQARQFAQEATFTDPLGKTMSGIQQFLNNMPGGKIMVPFVKTPTKIMVRFLERTPAGLAFDHVRADIAAGGARADMAVSRMATGTGMISLGMYMAMNGQITGEGPTDKAQRDALLRNGWRPRSVRIGDKYIEIGRLDPFASFFLAGANVVEVMDQMDNQPGGDLEKQMHDYIGMSALGASNFLLSKTWTQSFSELLDAFMSQDEAALERMVKFYGAAMAVPNAVKFVNDYVDPVMKETSSLGEEIRARAFGGGRPKLDVWGNPVTRDPAMMGVIPSSHHNIDHDKLEQTLANNGIYIRKPEKRIEGVELTADQYHQLMLNLKESGVREALDRFTSAPVFEQIPGVRDTGVPGARSITKKGVVNRIYNEHVKQARQKLVSEDVELKDRIRKFKIDQTKMAPNAPIVDRVMKTLPDS